MRRELTLQHRLADTLFVLVGDNGMAFGAHRWAKKNVPYATPIPLYMHWKAGLGSVPRTVSTWVSMIDIAPTIVDITGGYLGPYRTGQAGPDGTSLWGVLGGAELGRQVLLEEHPASAPGGMPPWKGVRTTDQSPLGLYTYREYDDGSRELYDLAADPYELQNVAGEAAYADVQATLASDLADLMSAPSPAWRWDVTPERVHR
jgi:arylsulfatase A-like enzyme